MSIVKLLSKLNRKFGWISHSTISGTTSQARDYVGQAQDFEAKAQFELAVRSYHKALEVLSGCATTLNKATAPAHGLMATCHNRLGIMLLNEGKPEEAGVKFDAAIAIRRAVARQLPEDRENQIYLGGSLCNRGHTLADIDPPTASKFYEECLQVIRQPVQTCECSYWDEARQSWWCSQLEAISGLTGAAWVQCAPAFIDNAMRAQKSLQLGG